MWSLQTTNYKPNETMDKQRKHTPPTKHIAIAAAILLMIIGFFELHTSCDTYSMSEDISDGESHRLMLKQYFDGTIHEVIEVLQAVPVESLTESDDVNITSAAPVS